MRGQRKVAAVDGVMLLNKPAGITSNQALQKVKRLLRARKAGHTGSLDPAATGMLPLCFGEATKICGYLLDADKSYRVTAKLGEATDTGDADGTVTVISDVPKLDAEDWKQLMAGFLGTSRQIPPMYSALKQGGKRLYELARKGESVERAPRPIQIDELTLLELRGTRLGFRVQCSKGTYVRTLVEDIAKAAGTVAHTAALHRESVGSFSADQMLDLATAMEIGAGDPNALMAHLLPVDLALGTWPDCQLAAQEVERFTSGQAVPGIVCHPGLVRVYDDGGRFLGVGDASTSGSVAPKRIFHLAGRPAYRPDDAGC